ncbi:MAG: FtsX-like permease family protein [Longimicrobiales bacterium]
MRGSPEHLALRAEVAQARVPGPTIFTVGPYINEPFVTAPAEVERAVVEQKRAGYDVVKLHEDLTGEAYARLNAIARREGIRVIGHAPRNLGVDAMFAERQYAVAQAEEFLYERDSSSRGMLSGFFRALALLLAMIGLYGIMAYTVARRRNEIGVRIALGAARSGILRLVFRDAGRMLLAGIAVGVVLSLASTRVVSTFLYGVEPVDAITLAASVLAFAGVALAAALLPAWRAARLDPVAALREE